MAKKKPPSSRKHDAPPEPVDPQVDAAEPADAVEPSHPAPHRERFPIVGIGASAGGLEALKQLFDAAPSEPGCAFVIIQHLDPTKASLTAELLATHTRMPVVQATDAVPVEKNHVYVIPPNKYMVIKAGKLGLREPQHHRGARIPIDYFLRSLADDQQQCAVAVILSGAGTDGTLGCKAVKTAGGLVVAQDPSSAQHDSMPRSAIATGIVDTILPPREIAQSLRQYARHPFLRTPPDDPSQREEGARVDLSTVLGLLRARTRYDFRCYKSATLLRRTQRRMALLHIEDFPLYLQYLREHADEVDALVRDLLISVTDFFRDAEAWEVLEHQVIEPLVRNAPAETPIRVWVPGCATGEEPYSVAMLLFEQLQRAGKSCPLQIFASDIDRTAIDYARHALYPQTIAADVSPARLQRFFTPVKDDHHFRVNKSVREAIVFAEQNLVGDPPFSKLDLICCRNVMIYLKPDVQHKLISLFHFALRETGYLFLGSAETVGRQEELFAPVSRKWRIYRKKDGKAQRDVEFPLVGPTHRDLEPSHSSHQRREFRLANLAQQRLLDWLAPSAVLIDQKWQILYFSGNCDAYLTHSSGAPTQDLLMKLRPGLRTKVRGAVQRAMSEGETVMVTSRMKRGTRFVPVQITARPIRQHDEDELLILLVFEDVAEGQETAATGSRSEGPRPVLAETEIDNDDVVRHLEDELAATREDLQSTIEQLGASNEEFKASNEEVMSVNEELQSSNEELETSKEELQSLNEELHTVNAQLSTKVDELEARNNDLKNLINSTDIATLCLDRAQRIKWFTPAITRLQRLVPADIGRRIGDFSLEKCGAQLLEHAEGVLHHLTPMELEVCTDDGRTYLRRVIPYRTDDNRIDGVVVSFFDITRRRQAEEDLRLRNLYFQEVFNLASVSMARVSTEGRLLDVNAQFASILDRTPESLLGTHIREVLSPEDRYDCQLHLQRLGSGETPVLTVEKRLQRRDGTPLWYQLTWSAVLKADQTVDFLFVLVQDIERRKQAETSLNALNESLEQQVADRVQLLSIIRDVAIAANEAPTVEQAALRTLERLCSTDGWLIAQAVFGVDDREAALRSHWYVHPSLESEPEKVSRFRQSTIVSMLHVDCPIARVIRSGQPEWLDDLRGSRLGRHLDWQELGLCACVAFPVRMEGRVIGVLEFFSRRPSSRDEVFMEIMQNVGLQLAHGVKRQLLEQEVASAAVEEQRRLGAELHDSVAQSLTGVSLLADTVADRLQSQAPDAAADLAKISRYVHDAQTQVRRLSRGLIPVEVEAEGLMMALEELAGRTQEVSGVACRFNCDERVDLPDNDMATQLFRIAQEAVHNSLRHSKPAAITIRLDNKNEAVTLRVEDDGGGMKDSAVAGAGRRIMEYRAHLIGGELQIDSRAGQGVAVICRVPLRQRR